MKKLLSSLLAISFILWIMPLGSFIKPSQEKLACDGQRAMCMCHALILKSDKAMEPGMAIKSGSSANKENTSGNGSNYVVSMKPAFVLNPHSASIFENQFLIYKNPCPPAPEFVPKF